MHGPKRKHNRVYKHHTIVVYTHGGCTTLQLHCGSLVWLIYVNGQDNVVLPCLYFSTNNSSIYGSLAK